MGQRTQIIIVEDTIEEGKNKGDRFITAHHDQWGYGRPVIFDILYLISKISTGASLCPQSYDSDYKSGDAYKRRQLLHHNCPLDYEAPGKRIEIDLFNKADKELNKSAMDFVEMFDMFDNNNGGAVLWIVHKRRADFRKETAAACGFLIGPEDSENAFAGYVDAVTYMKKVSPQLATKEFNKLINDSFKYFGVSLMDPDETLKKILENKEV